MADSKPLGKLVAQTPSNDLASKLSSAATAGNISQIETLLTQNQNLLDEELLLSAAQSAAQANQPTALRTLLAHGAPADPIIATTCYSTATPEIYQTLYDHGWRPEQNDPRDPSRPGPGELPLLLRLLPTPNTPTITWLLTHLPTPLPSTSTTSGPHTPLSIASNIASTQLLTTLHNPPYNIPLRDSNALHSASRSKHPDSTILPLMHHLLDLGIDIDAREVFHNVTMEGAPRWSSKERGTALQAAIQAGKVERVKWLLEHGADGMKKSESGFTPMEWARQCGSGKEMLDILRAGGCQ